MYQKTLPFIGGMKNSILLFFAAIFAFSSSFAQNAIVTENALPGTPEATWDIPTADAGDLSIQGFATDISVNKGGTINFKIDVNTGGNRNFDITIYRLGYYQGNGARQIVDLGNFTGIGQAACFFDNTTGLTDCGNWTTTASWNVPANAVSGLYIAKLTRAVGGVNATSHIPFIVRDDAGTSNLFFKTSDATWQAYNGYGGYSLYIGAGMPFNHGDKVSYNRPFITRSGTGGGGVREDWFMNAEYPMIRFLESNGYDISYITDMDIARDNANSINRLLGHKVFLSVGHDEYWSKEERNSVEAAKAAGKNLAFFSGNESYWKTRWENSSDGANTPYRTMVCYKEGTLATAVENPCGFKCDPNAEWTGLWRDGCSDPTGNACKPENALSGEISWDGVTDAITVPFAYKNLRFWRNTPNIVNLTAGNSYSFAQGTLGYEWDWEQYQSTYPPGRVTMSNTVSDQNRVHKLSLYRDVSSKAIVFGAGTVQWAWGLDSHHDANQGFTGAVDQNMQQATINLLTDMGSLAATIQSPLILNVLAPDNTPPVTVISSPVNGATLVQNTPITISGTATDVGGIVAGVQVSLDGGVSWQDATGTNNWTFSWTPNLPGPITIESRGFDDIGNLETPGGSEGSANTVNVTVVAPTPPTNCPCTIFTPAQGPDPTDPGENNENDGHAITLGVKFRAAFDGTISAIRYFAATSDNTPGHIVKLWTLDGTPLGIATQVGLSTGGQWNEVTFSAPVSITANTIYVATYYSPNFWYTSTDNAFINPVINGPLTIIADSARFDPTKPNGAFLYDSQNFPTTGAMATNYWIDVLYSNGADITPPTVISSSPVNGAVNVSVNSFISATFSENMDPTTINVTSLILKDASNTVVPATVTYTSNSKTGSIIPTSALSYSSVYTATIVSGASGVKDLAGNALVTDFTFSFTTSPPPAVPPDDGAGGPVLIVSNTLNPFSRYMVEILRAQGYTEFEAMDISEVTPAILLNYDVVLLGNMTASSGLVSMLTPWVNAGGTLIAQHPSSLLWPLMGITASGTVLSDAYVLVNTTSGLPGAGIVNQTIQYHGPADEYTLSGATSLATLYSSAATATIFPAVTTNSIGANGGKTIAFAYDLARSVVTTRQGNPALVGLHLDGQSGPSRSDNMFMGTTPWLDFNKVAIPQADEQQHFLTNIILQSNLHKKPLPHLWILPSGLKAAVVMTGDDHNVNYGSTETRFNEYVGLSADNSPASVANWTAVRGTSYIYNNTPIPQDSVAYFQSLGFEIALHPTTLCVDFTPSSLSSDLTTQVSALEVQYPALIPPVTNRTHCLPWSDWSSQPLIENSLGIRFDVNYYYWPGTWIQNRPGMFTGSGMPMRFSDLNGAIIDAYQAPTQITDESGQDIPFNIATLLDNAINLGYYGAFVMNMHTDQGIHPGSDAITSAAASRSIPVIAAKQMLNWLDTRNSTAFSNMAWDNVNKKLSFHLATTATNLQAMVPFNSADGTLIQVTENGSNKAYTLQTIKGVSYGFFNASTNDYVAFYTSTILPITLTSFTVTKQGDDAQLNWTTSMEENNKGFEVQRSTDQSSWSVLGFVTGAGNSQTPKYYQYLDQNLPAGTYYYRLRQVDYDGHSTFSKVLPVTFDGDLSLELKQNRPNPFNNSTQVDIVIPKSGRVQLILYDQMGRPIQQLMDEFRTPGTYTIQVNRNGLSSGIYYYKMNALGQSIVRKMTIL
jgi:large repetitive protein